MSSKNTAKEFRANHDNNRNPTFDNILSRRLVARSAQYAQVGVEGGHVGRDDGTPVTALDVELLEAEPLHELPHHDGHLDGAQAGPRGRVREAVAGQ